MEQYVSVRRSVDRRMGNHGTSVNSSSHAESSWRLNELTKGVITIEVGSLVQYFVTHIEKDKGPD